ncbi:MAG: cation:proton antiporter, partial [Candidatus Aenigmarchaeota archaeon]|nr:cation:proton antiporter [Candidatus Aenigmarchaeota archaeon]
MQVEFTLIICLLISILSVWIAKKLKLSVTVALTIAGILIGSPLLRNTILGPNVDFILTLGDIGLVSMMFLAGMEVSWSMMYKERKDAFIIASFATFVPLILGFIIFLGMGYSLLTSLTVGICLSITAEATKARELLELKKLKTKLGSLMLGAGISDDLIGVFSFVLVCYLFTGTIISEELSIFLTAIFMFGAGML